MFENMVTTRLTNERWLNLYKTTFVRNGIRGEWAFASRGRGLNNDPLKTTNAVVVVAMVDADVPRVVVIKEYRVPIQDYEHHFPAGLIEIDQTIEQAAAAELLQEAGCVLNEVIMISPSLISSAGAMDETSRLVLCTCTPGQDQQLEPQEVIEPPMLLDAAQLEAMLNDDSVRWAAKSWPILMFYVLPILKSGKLPVKSGESTSQPAKT